MTAERDLRITRIEPFGPARNRARLYVDGELRCDVALSVVTDARLREGDTVSPGRLDSLLEKDAHWKARESALRLLAYRACSRAEIRRRLYQKGFAAPVVERCVARLLEEGLVDDESFARAYVRDTVRSRPRGRLGMSRELRRKGVGEELVRRAVDEVMEEEGTSETGLAVETAARWVRRQRLEVLRGLLAGAHRPERERARRRLYGYLDRRGFSGDAIRRAIDEAEARARRVVDERE